MRRRGIAQSPMFSLFSAPHPLTHPSAHVQPTITPISGGAAWIALKAIESIVLVTWAESVMRDYYSNTCGLSDGRAPCTANMPWVSLSAVNTDWRSRWMAIGHRSSSFSPSSSISAPRTFHIWNWTGVNWSADEIIETRLNDGYFFLLACHTVRIRRWFLSTVFPIGVPYFTRTFPGFNCNVEKFF